MKSLNRGIRILLCAAAWTACLLPVPPHEAAADPGPWEHPRLFLDEERLALVRAKAAGGDADFLELKQYADARMSPETLPDPWNFGAAFSGSKEGYRGSHYLDRVLAFGLLYHVYKESDPALAAAYAEWAVRVLDEIVLDFTVALPGVAASHNEGLEAIREFGTINSDEFEILVQSGFYQSHFDFPVTQPPNYKGGYAARNFGFAMAVGYDWLHELLPPEKQELFRSVMYRWCDWYQGRRTARNTGANYDGVFYHEDRDGEDGPADNSNIAGPWGDRPSTGYGLYAESGNFFGGYFLMHALTAFATYGDDPGSQDVMDTFQAVWSRLRLRLEDRDDLAGGDCPEGWQYGTAYQAYVAQALLGIAQHFDPGPSFAWPGDTLLAFLHSTKPFLRAVHLHGEWTSSWVGPYDKGVLALGAYLRGRHDPLAGLAQHHLRHAAYVPETRSTAWQRTLFLEPDAPETPPGSLPVLYESSGTGLVLGRSSWTDAAGTVWFSLQAGGNYYGDHEAYDAGHFTLTRGQDDLLIRTGSRHVENQNTVSFTEPGATAVIQNPRPTGVGERRVRQEEELLYVMSDLTASQWEGATHVRQLLCFRPDLFLLYDRMTSAPGASAAKRWHFNTGPDTEVDAENRTIVARSGGSQALIRTLLPAGISVELADLGDALRGALSPIAPQEAERFLHLILPMSRDASPAVASALIETPDVTGAELRVDGRGFAAVFCRGGDLLDQAVFSLTLEGDRKVFVADLAAGTYRVLKNGAVLVPAVEAEEHAVFFPDTGPGGTYAVQPASQPPNAPPELAPVGGRTVQAGSRLSFQVAASDPDGTVPALEAAPLPAGASFADHGDGTAQFSWTPQESAEGDHEVTFTASDGELADEETVIITVQPAGQEGPWFERLDAGLGGQTWGFGTAVADYDGDGLPDAAFLNHGYQAGEGVEIHRNNGDLTFSPVWFHACATNAASIVDMNGDGAPDLVVTADGFPVLLLTNRSGPGEIDFAAEDLPIPLPAVPPDLITELAWGDTDLDGDLDLLSGNTQAAGTGGFLWERTGGRSFQKTGAVRVPGACLPRMADLDNDGDPDLLAGSYGVPGGDPKVRVYIQDPAGVFEDRAGALGIDAFASFDLGFADLDSDGDQDLLSVWQACRVYRNLLIDSGASGPLAFADATGDSGLPPNGGLGGEPLFADLNNDGLPDFVVHGYNGSFDIYVNRGGLHFEKLEGYTDQRVFAGVGDVDRDGRLDILAQINTGYDPRPNYLLHNTTGGSNHWLGLELVGSSADNRQAAGARIWVYAPGELGNPNGLVTSTQVSLFSSSPHGIHLGLGSAASADVRVRFPSGAETVLESVAADGEIQVLEGPPDWEPAGLRMHTAAAAGGVPSRAANVLAALLAAPAAVLLLRRASGARRRSR